jgi:hypothetical protein
MSSLIFCTEEMQVVVATDTLATRPDGTPFLFTTKAFVVPHLRMVVAGTGAGGFLGRWFIRVNDRMVIRGIDHLNDHTQRALGEMWTLYRQEFKLPEDLTTTVYHFGFSEVTGRIHSYAYRSTANFQPEPRPYGIGVKPECSVPSDCKFPTDIKMLMNEQRHIQAGLPRERRIYIGGEITIHHLSKEGCFVYTLDRFEDYAQDERAMYENFARP